MPRCAPALSALLCVLVCGCAARLENPEAFEGHSPLSSGAGGATAMAGNPGNAGSPGGSASGGGGLGGAARGGAPSASAGTAGVPTSDAPACVLALFANTASGKCSSGICHHAGSDAPGGLDLASPGVAARLVDQAASHLGASPNSGCPQGDKLIDSNQPGASWLLKKLSLGSDAACGARMPLTGSLTADELSCLTTWVTSF